MEGLSLVHKLVKVEQTVPGNAGEVSKEANEKESFVGISRNHLGRLQTISGKGIGD